MTHARDITSQFIAEIEKHEMHVLREDGVYRHIRFKRPGTMCMHFDLITWPGYLCYTGDMGTFVFTRLLDMFQFFRRGDGDRRYRIDFRYWAEKVEGADKSDNVQEFDADAFREAVKVARRKLIRESKEYLDKEDRREMWDQVDYDVLDRIEDRGDGELAFHLAFEFSYSIGSWGDPGYRRFGFDLEDFPSCKTFSHRFLWCCHALAWGIKLYDTAKQPAEALA